MLVRVPDNLVRNGPLPTTLHVASIYGPFVFNTSLPFLSKLVVPLYIINVGTYKSDYGQDTHPLRIGRNYYEG